MRSVPFGAISRIEGFARAGGALHAAFAAEQELFQFLVIGNGQVHGQERSVVAVVLAVDVDVLGDRAFAHACFAHEDDIAA